MSVDPKTIDEARQHRYGCWAGNPRGRAYEEGRCVVEFFPSGRGELPRQCMGKAGHGPGGAYCANHDPARVAARDRARQEAYDAELREKKFEWNGKKFYDALKKIADGHNDPRALACETIRKFENPKER